MTYPHEPGYKDQDTSKAAATLVAPRAPALLAVIVDLLTEGPASPEQLHAKLAERGQRELLTSIRARVCQLHKQGRVTDTGLRGIGESGVAKVKIWRLTTPEERQLIIGEKGGAGSV